MNNKLTFDQYMQLEDGTLLYDAIGDTGVVAGDFIESHDYNDATVRARAWWLFGPYTLSVLSEED